MKRWPRLWLWLLLGVPGMALAQSPGPAETSGQLGAWSFKIEEGVRVAAHISTNASLTVTCGADGWGRLDLQVEAGPVWGFTELVFEDATVLLVPFEAGVFAVASEGQASVFAQVVAALKSGGSVAAVREDGLRLVQFSLFGAAEMIGDC